jgi:hypothetical protein
MSGASLCFLTHTGRSITMSRSDSQTAIQAMVDEGVPYEIAAIARRNAAMYKTIQERWCNEEMSDRTTATLEAREQRMEARIRDLLAPYGITVSFQGDPRGYCVYLHLPSGRYNSWGGKEYGFGIG